MTRSRQKLIELVDELVTMLESTEESDNGRTFHPTTISSCRCLHTQRLSEIMPEIKHLLHVLKS